MDSILTSVKKDLGIASDYTYFDADIIMAINTAFSVLNQIGAGPEEGFSISDDTAVWTDFISDLSKLEMVKTYVSKKVRMIFDPPISSPVAEATNNVIAELEWRISVAVDPSPSTQNGA